MTTEKGGKPTVYKSWMYDKTIELLSQGKSIVYLAAELGVGRQSIYDWKKHNPEFLEAIEIGLAKSQQYWEDQLADCATGRNTDANAASLIFTMKNRFRDDWKDHQDVSSKNQSSVMVKAAITEEEISLFNKVLDDAC